VVRVDTRAQRRADPTRRFDELFRRLYPRLYDLSHRLLVDRWEAEDVVQEAFLRLVGAAVIDRPDQEVEAWLRRVCVNLGYAATLRQLGVVHGDLGGVEPAPVATPAAASRLVGFPVALPAAAALPSGVDPRPRIVVSPARQLRFTLDAAKVGRYLEGHGRSGASVPAGLDGATLVANVPAAALLEYVAADGSPRLVVGQSRELTASVQGTVTLEALREFLLDLPGLPPQTVRQLRAIGDWRDTLPLPVPADRIDWRSTTIHGVQGLLLGERNGLGSAVIWQRDGRIYGVAGLLRQASVRRVAESLD